MGTEADVDGGAALIPPSSQPAVATDKEGTTGKVHKSKSRQKCRFYATKKGMLHESNITWTRNKIFYEHNPVIKLMTTF